MLNAWAKNFPGHGLSLTFSDKGQCYCCMSQVWADLYHYKYSFIVIITKFIIIVGNFSSPSPPLPPPYNIPVTEGRGGRQEGGGPRDGAAAEHIPPGTTGLVSTYL